MVVLDPKIVNEIVRGSLLRQGWLMRRVAQQVSQGHRPLLVGQLYFAHLRKAKSEMAKGYGADQRLSVLRSNTQMVICHEVLIDKAKELFEQQKNYKADIYSCLTAGIALATGRPLAVWKDHPYEEFIASEGLKVVPWDK